MKQDLENLKQDFLSAIKNIDSSTKLEQLRVEFLGRKGKLANLLKKLPELSDVQRREAGALANEIKTLFEETFARTQTTLDQQEKASREQKEWLDITVPGAPASVGSLHLVSQAIEEISQILSRLGFVRVSAPEVDWDWYAFESLNMPRGHAARDEWETFFIKDPKTGKIMEGERGKVVLTPHTSNSQGHVLEKHKLPVRMFNINKCYRRQMDVTHTPMFHQFEGLLVDKKVSICDLKGLFDFFVQNYFGAERKTRLRPHHFPFTEPSFELDISCAVCAGSGKVASGNCRMCKAGWLELGGAGMVHPNVLKANGLDPEKLSGFAFGWGVERTLSMKSGVNIGDIRLLYRNDLRFLKQF